MIAMTPKNDMGYAAPNTVSPFKPDVHDTKVYNIKSYVEMMCNILPICWCTFPLENSLILEPEELVLRKKTPCNEVEIRKPYGELGSVDIGTSCCCCWGVSFYGSQPGGISPKWGCSKALVQEIHSELKKRQQTRGDQGQIQRADQTLTAVQSLEQKMDRLEANMAAIMTHLNIPQQQQMVERL